MFFNTIHVRGDTLTEYEIQTEFQEEMVAEFFRRQPTALVTPEDLLKYHPAFSRTPITSIRRAFSNLYKAGVIEKTDHQVDGMYGMPIYCWRLAGTGQGDLFPS